MKERVAVVVEREREVTTITTITGVTGVTGITTVTVSDRSDSVTDMAAVTALSHSGSSDFLLHHQAGGGEVFYER